MSLRTGLVVLLAIVFGLTAAVGVAKYSEGLGSSQSTEETVTVVVAIADIPRGSPVTAEMIKTREYPKSVAPTGAVSRLEDTIQRVPKDNILKDEPVLEARLSPKGSPPGIANVIPPGMWAMSIKTTNVASVGSGFILPGNKVDVLYTKRSQNMMNDTLGGGSTTILVQSVEVLAINQNDQNSGTRMDMKDLQSATLLVTPQQGADLELAQALGTLTLVLRSENDKSAVRIIPPDGHSIAMKVGKPIDPEKVKALVDALPDAWAKMQEVNAKMAREQAANEKAERERAAKEQPKVIQIEATEVPLVIRTFRGNVPGRSEVPIGGQ